MSAFPVVDVSGWERTQDETEGKDEKHWCRAPGSDSEWVFKRVSDDRAGSHWAEKIAGEIATAMGMPAARIELAVYRGTTGVISRDARPSKEWEQHGGAVLLEETMPGYLLFDAFVANQDRHARNWAVMRKPGTPTALMASYDHGSSLGYRLTDEYRQRHLDDSAALRRWCERGKAERFDGRPSLLGLANRALGLAQPGVAEYWRARVADVTDDQIRAIVERTPVLSDVGANFIREVLITNRRRLLDV